MHSLWQRRISSGSSSISSSSVVAARSLTLQLQDIHVKRRRGTASQQQTFRIWHPRLHAAGGNLEEQIETTLMARLLTTLRYRLKLAPSSQRYPWLESQSKCTHFTKATVKWDWCPGGWKGPRCVGAAVRHTNAFSMPFFFPPGLPLGCTSSLSPLTQGLRPGAPLAPSVYKTPRLKYIQRLVQKHLMFVALRPLCPFKLEKSFCLSSPQMEMVMQARKNVINNTNWGPLWENFSSYSAWICHAIRSLSGFSWLFTYACISHLPHMVFFPYLIRV